MSAIIGITGYAQHGKDTIGQRLVDRHGFARYAFADQLREMLYRLDPIVDCGTGESYQGLIDTVGYEEAKKLPEVRRLLQVLGTECVRDIIGQDAWVNALWNKVVPGGVMRTGPVVITDVRFPNEAESIWAHGGYVVRVTRPGFENGIPTDHPSEAHVASLPVDLTLGNDSTIEELQVLTDGLSAWLQVNNDLRPERGPQVPTADDLKELFL